MRELRDVNTLELGSSADAVLKRTALGELSVLNGATGALGTLKAATSTVDTVNATAVVAFTVTATGSAVVTTANGGQWIRGQVSELITIAAAATSDSAANLLPANAIIEAVIARVTVAIPTAATFTIGDATTAGRFATAVAVAKDTTAVGILQHNTANSNAAGPVQTAAAKIRVTPDQTPATATGRLRVTVFYRQFVPPTS